MNLEDFIKKVMPTKNKLYRFALSLLKNRQDAEDIVQEVLIKVWTKNESLSFYRNIEAWCMTMTKNMSLDKLKSKEFQLKAQQSTFQEVADEPQPDSDDLSSAVSNVKKIIEGLPIKQREVMQLRDIEGYSYQEITEILKLEMNQVKVNLFRARKAVRAKMLNTEDYGS